MGIKSGSESRYWFNELARDPNPRGSRIGGRFGRRARFSFMRPDGKREYHSEIFRLGKQFHPARKVVPA